MKTYLVIYQLFNKEREYTYTKALVGKNNLDVLISIFNFSENKIKEGYLLKIKAIEEIKYE